MDRIARAVEPSLGYRHELAQAADQPFPTVGEAMSNAACDIAEVLGAAAILVPTYSRADGVGRRAPSAAPADHRRHAQAPGGAAARARVGSRPRGDRGGRRRRATSGPGRSRRRARPGSSSPGDRDRDHRGHGRERARHDEPDQGRDRLSAKSARSPSDPVSTLVAAAGRRLWAAVEVRMPMAARGSPPRIQPSLEVRARASVDRHRRSPGRRGRLRPAAARLPAGRGRGRRAPRAEVDAPRAPQRAARAALEEAETQRVHRALRRGGSGW